LGDIAIDQSDPAATPIGELSLEQTISKIESAGSWLALRNIETDPEYRTLLHECLADILPVARRRTGAPDRIEGFIFLSSPHAVTPFHFDPEHNILLQIRGRKTVTVFPPDDPEIVSAEKNESFHCGGHCNLRFDTGIAAKGAAFDIGPGEALHIPVKAPHWVINGDAVSLSLSLTWRSPMTERARRVYRLNAKMRELGLAPGLLGEAPVRDRAKDALARVLERVRLI
jgi:quercetin dioxygenase-like cupin family protein